jgi:hypothetical protein
MLLRANREDLCNREPIAFTLSFSITRRVQFDSYVNIGKTLKLWLILIEHSTGIFEANSLGEIIWWKYVSFLTGPALNSYMSSRGC